MSSRSAAAEPQCSFCSAPRARVRALIAGPGLFICDACVHAGVQIMLEETAEATPPGAVCSFCQKARAEVQVLIPGPGIHICNECVSLCNDILTSGVSPETQPRPPELPIARVRVKPWWRRWRARG